MDISVTINFWFMVSLCLTFALGGMMLGVRLSKQGEGRSKRYYNDRY